MGKKLIEVALPLEAINRESAREKGIRQGHPSTLHVWWSRKPLATARAVLFASLVDDPSARPDEFPTDELQNKERQRLFRLIEEMVKWESTANDALMEKVRAEILRSTGGKPPPVLDPFAGGGSIPLEAQRLGLDAHATDLNPVAVLINKALIEIPPKFSGETPVHPLSDRPPALNTWTGAQGLAEDVRYYGHWMSEEAARRIGHLYPKASLPASLGGGEATVIAWVWARTVISPNPAWAQPVPLVNKWTLATKPNRRVWIEPCVDDETKTIRYETRTGSGNIPSGTVNRQGATCIATGTPIPFSYIRSEAKAGRMGQQLIAIVCEGDRKRVYLAPTEEHESIALSVHGGDLLDSDLPDQALGFRVQAYGMTRHRDLYTERQLLALTTLTGLVGEVRARVESDAVRAGRVDDHLSLAAGGLGASAYADAIATYLAFVVSRLSDYCSTITTWASNPQMEILRNTFSRQAISMTWDFAEGNVFGPSSGTPEIFVGAIAKVLDRLDPRSIGTADQLDAASPFTVEKPLVSTDPPYYDNIGYADLSDYFYVWLRPTLSSVFPDELSTLLVPKARELVADPHRFNGSKASAQEHFEDGLAEFFRHLHNSHDPAYPVTIYYAFKQAEASDDGEVASTGWETMLAALLDAGFAVRGTWPVRSERGGRMRSIGSNALASSIVLVCRPRAANAPLATRREFIAALKAELPDALKHLQQGSIAPVDLAQAAIGPGMSVFSSFSRVVEADGSATTVRTALGLINQVLDETLAEQEGDFDPDTRWAVAWFEQFGVSEAPYGQAETLSKAKNTSVQGLVDAGVLESRAGKVRLLDRHEMSGTWDPTTDTRLTVWEVTQHLIRALAEGGEQAAADLHRRVGPDIGETARELSYLLYTICERKKWAGEALAYNSLVVAWPEITRLAASVPQREPVQGEML